jgi:hypothetical protein
MSTESEPLLPIATDYGAFHLDWLLMQLEVDPKEYLDQERFRSFKSSATDVNKKVEFALGQAAFVHETRHFHDVFGTRSGINLFLAKFHLLQEFVRRAPIFAKKAWALPVTKASFTDMDPEAWRFLNYALDVKRVCRRFQCQLLPSPITNEVPPDPLPYVSRLREESFGTIVYAFPARVTFLTPEHKQIPAIQHIPIAFDALLEGNAQAIQRSMVEMLWDNEVASHMFALTGVSIRQPGAQLGYAPTYNATDLMVTRYLEHASGKIVQFPRNAVLALTDHALTAAIEITENTDGTRTVSLECPGHSFVNLLEDTGPEAIRAGQIEPPLDEGYRALRDFYAAVSSFETVDDTMSGPAADIEVLFRWIARNVIAPLLSARLSTHHKVFSDIYLWMSQLPSLPQVPFRIRPDGSCISSAPKRVIDAWLRIRIFERLLAQLTNGEPVILCPRAHNTAPGIEKVNFANTGDCDEYIAADLCGRFHTGMPVTALPKCLFRDSLVYFGFATPARTEGSGTTPAAADEF